MDPKMNKNANRPVRIPVKRAQSGQHSESVPWLHMSDASSDANQQQSTQSRFGSRFGSSSNNQQANQTNNNNTNNNQQNTPGSRFASRFGSSNNNQQQATGSRPASPPPPPPNPFAANQRRWTIQPIGKTVVRFELRGMGDPFFRMLGYPLNNEYGDFNKLLQVFEQGGEAIEEIVTHLNQVWQQLDLQGAIMVYPFNRNTWTGITSPVNNAANNQQNQQDQESDDGDFDLEASKDKTSPYVMIRALDMGLTLNVLARARTQLLIVESPLVLSGQYLARSLITDDPRLVELVKATGFMEEV